MLVKDGHGRPKLTVLPGAELDALCEALGALPCVEFLRPGHRRSRRDRQVALERACALSLAACVG